MYHDLCIIWIPLVHFQLMPFYYDCSVQFSSVAQSCPTLRPHDLQHTRPPCPSPTPGVHSNSCPLSHLILCHPLLLLPSIFPSIRVFLNESVLHIRWPKYWGFSISSSSEYSRLISFRIDWFNLLTVQGTLKSTTSSWSPFVTIHKVMPTRDTHMSL